MKKYILIGFDLESTDKKVTEDEITQIAFSCKLCEIRKDPIALGEKGFETLVKCNKKISEEASRITGITNEKLKNAPVLLDALDLVSNYLNKTCIDGLDRILIAYNGINFDIPLLVHELRRNGKDPILYFREWKIAYFIDPFLIAKNVLDTTLLEQNDRQQPNYKLECIYRALLKKPLIDAHSALADTEAMLELIIKISCIFNVMEEEIIINKEGKYLRNFLSIAGEVKETSQQKQKKKGTKRQVINLSGMRSLIVKYAKK